MIQSYNLSPVLRELLEMTESMLGIELQLVRRTDVPPQGLLIDEFTYGTGKNIIAFSSALLGTLKDYTICRNCIELLARGCAARRGNHKVLSFSKESTLEGCRQIYLDILKDEGTRNLPVWQKKQLVPLLFMLLQEVFSEMPLKMLADLVISHRFSLLRNAQVYSLLKESMRDMHDLVPVKDFLPQRYYVVHNGVYYARDMVLAYALSEYKLNPVINIPELQRFKNLDMKEMMTHRWSRSPWYHTKVVGDALSNMLKRTIEMDFSREFSMDYFYELYVLSTEIPARWWVMMGMQDWFLWDRPEAKREVLASQAAIEKFVREEIFGPD